MQRSSAHVFAALCLMLLPACGGGGGGGGGVTLPSKTVVSVSVTGNATFTAPGQTSQLNAAAQFSDGSSQDVTSTATWKSAIPGVATVSASGLVAAVSAGTSDITATYQNVAGTRTVQVQSAGVSAITIDGNTSFTGSGQTSQLTATAQLADGSKLNVTTSSNWAIADTSVATLGGGGGQVTSQNNGLTEVSATYLGVRGTKSVEVRMTKCSGGKRFDDPDGNSTYLALSTQGCENCHKAGSRYNFRGSETDVYNTALLLIRPGDPDNSSLYRVAGSNSSFNGHVVAKTVNPCYPGSWCGDIIKNWIQDGGCAPH